MSGLPQYAALLAVAAIATALLTPACAAIARRAGLVVTPRADRWHRQPTPLLGGLAIGLVALVVLAIALPLSRTSLAIVGCGMLALALGLVDDFRRIAPSSKLVGQIVVGSVLVFAGVEVRFVQIAPIAFLVTVFWVVAMMNAINLVDNMDGLAAGVTVIGAIALALGAAFDAPTASVVAIVTAGAALGFLFHNFSPARVFMGDAGSQLLGFLLAATALLHSAAGATNLSLAVLAPLAALAFPIFDTTLVTVSRRIAGLPVSQGGRDHSSHRLAALGLTDRSAVLVLYGLSIAVAALGLVSGAIGDAVIPLFALAAIFFVLFGIFLHEVEVYARHPQAPGAPASPAGRVVRGLSLYGRFGAEVGMDAVLLTVAYYSSYLIRFEGFSDTAWNGLFTQSVPLVVGAQLAALVVLGVYRTLWRYLTVSDAAQIVRALAFGTAAAALVIFLGFRLQDYSRVVFLLDAVLAAALLVASRSFLLWLRQLFAARPRGDAKRVLIVGATDRGISALRLLTRSGEIAYRAVGFLDDDPGKRYRRVAGVPVLGTLADVAAAIGRHRVDVVVVAEAGPATESIRAACREAGVECREFLLPV